MSKQASPSARLRSYALKVLGAHWRAGMPAARGPFLGFLMQDAQALNELMGSDAVRQRADEFLMQIWSEMNPSAETSSGGQDPNDAQSIHATRSGGEAAKSSMKPTEALSSCPVGPGSVFVLPTPLRHDLENTGKDTLRAVAFFAAAMFTQTFDQVMMAPQTHILGTPHREGQVTSRRARGCGRATTVHGQSCPSLIPCPRRSTPAPWRGHGFPRSHGPPEQSFTATMVNKRLTRAAPPRRRDIIIGVIDFIPISA